MAFLIDGYNLIHALGLIRGPTTGPHGLERARLALLGLLHGTHGEESAAVTVVFDAAAAPAGLAREQDYQGIHVLFAPRRQEADDLIEDLIRHASAPRRLTVVSDDQRLLRAARRRRCPVLHCGEYRDWLLRQRRLRSQPPAEGPDKPDHVPEAERQLWEREFAGLEADPDLKELFELDRFEQPDD